MKLDGFLSMVFGILFTNIPAKFPIMPALSDIVELWPAVYRYYNYFILYWIGVAVFHIIKWTWKRTNDVDSHKRELLKELKEQI
jgi:hypothetical protein